jgi:retron-type reverse transcriptase
MTLNRLRDHLSHLEKTRAAGVAGYTVAEVTDNLDWIAQEVLRKIQTQGYHPPPVQRVWRPQPGKAEKRPMGMPTVCDRALQTSTAQVLEAIEEQDLLTGSFGGRPGRSAHHALATLHEIIAGKQGSSVLEADLRNCFGSVDHTWAMRFVQLRGWGSSHADAHAPVASSRRHEAGWNGGGRREWDTPRGQYQCTPQQGVPALCIGFVV